MERNDFTIGKGKTMTKKDLETLFRLLEKLQLKTSEDGSVLAPRVDDAGKFIDMAWWGVGTPSTPESIANVRTVIRKAYDCAFNSPLPEGGK
mgnify:CR=1 FL=1